MQGQLEIVGEYCARQNADYDAAVGHLLLAHSTLIVLVMAHRMQAVKRGSFSFAFVCRGSITRDASRGDTCVAHFQKRVERRAIFFTISAFPSNNIVMKQRTLIDDVNRETALFFGMS